MDIYLLLVTCLTHQRIANKAERQKLFQHMKQSDRKPVLTEPQLDAGSPCSDDHLPGRNEGSVRSCCRQEATETIHASAYTAHISFKGREISSLDACSRMLWRPPRHQTRSRRGRRSCSAPAWSWTLSKRKHVALTAHDKYLLCQTTIPECSFSLASEVDTCRITQNSYSFLP